MELNRQQQQLNSVTMDSQETKQAKQRASVKWILSKAYSNRVPDNLKEPFFKDHEGQEHLKPQIVVGLGNASLYCQVLSNIYSDPNYQSLNHWSILQTLSRKGVPIHESSDQPLTETVLIQTNPIRINAHMSVIEALMILYAKEVTSGDKIQTGISRITGGQISTGLNYEQLLLLWVSHVCAALKRRVDQEIKMGVEYLDETGKRIPSPDIPTIHDYTNLCDGVCLAYLISYYCPKILPWTSVRISYLPTVEDSIYNVLLVSNFSQRNLPYTVFHMTPEDITYMRGAMKQNLIVLLADLFNLFEIHPANCVCYPGMEQAEKLTTATNEHGISHHRGVHCQPINPIPDLRSGLDSPTHSTSGRPPFQVTRSPSATTIYRHHTPPKDVLQQQTSQQSTQQNIFGDDNNGFVVHKSKGITTLSTMQDPLIPARIRQAKEKTNNDSKADERGDSSIPAGRPSNWEEQRRSSFAGRRSRRNSFSEESQLTIENFGGSQDQLNMMGTIERRTLDRERKISAASMGEPAVAIRSSITDARGTLQIGFDSDSEKQDKDTEKTTLKRQASNVSSNSVHSKEKDLIDGDMTRMYSNSGIMNDDINMKRKSQTTFATLANPTTWQQQSINAHPIEESEDTQPIIDASKLSTIRLKLEEKRRQIEQEKRRMEAAMSKQLQKVGKAAFLQAINKRDKNEEDDNKSLQIEQSGKPERPSCLQDLNADTNSIEQKWNIQIESKRTPDMEHISLEQYQQSIALMNSDLNDIQADIQKLANQQNQIQAQTIQAQQLLQAQQIANILNQQYSSQQNIPSAYRPLNQNFGSSPHLPQHLQQQINPQQNFTLRQQQQQQQQQQQPQQPQQQQQQSQQMQFINEQGQYVMQQTQQQQPQQYNNHQKLYSRENSQTQLIGQKTIGQYGHIIDDQYSGNQYLNREQHQHIQQYVQDTNHYRDQFEPQPPQQQFYLHDQQPQTPPQPTQRRTWAQSAAASANHSNVEINTWSQSPQQQQQQPQQQQQQQPQQQFSKYDTITWKSSPSQSQNQSGFMLHNQNGQSQPDKYGSEAHLFQVHSSPQNSRVHKQISQIINHHINDNRQQPKSPQQIKDNHTGDEDMAPQSISFIADEDNDDEILDHHVSMTSKPLNQFTTFRKSSSASSNSNKNITNNNNQDLEISLGRLNITSGNRTYRIASPTRQHPHATVLNSNSFQGIEDPQDDVNEKGFYISFDNEQPKRPKPPLRTKRSPKKEKSLESEKSNRSAEKDYDKMEPQQVHDMPVDEPPIAPKRLSEIHHERKHANALAMENHRMSPQQHHHQPHHQQHHQQERNSYHNNNNSNGSKDNKALIIDSELTNLDPTSVDEMERKKEKIMLMSLQRRQQQEEAKARKEIDAMQRREKEREKEEERIRKKEEQASRRAQILEQHRLKKALEEAEREGKTLDRNTEMLLKQQQHQHHAAAPTPKMRATQKTTRARPKTIHVEPSSIDISEASSLGSRSKKGSNSNLTGVGLSSSNSMRRDYYRGSQDSLAIRESPDEYPSNSNSSTPLDRRGSYKIGGREPVPVIERGRTLSRISVAKGVNFRGRKSNSLMNLCDSDSGLGRATPPRRAPSPGMGSSSTRHLPSPSGPGSLPPGLMTKRRGYDDGSSDISSTASSIMDYNGPRLYKQPATKSNRGILLNAVEYCVFPGAVNRDAKQKVLEKIARSEAKHFLILFRDAGCQFRALYSYWPENETVLKLYGTGPSQVDDVMFDKFFKYNSGGKCFTQVHTKHLTVTIDAFTIHNSLWQGKKVNLPSKKDMALVI